MKKDIQAQRYEIYQSMAEVTKLKAQVQALEERLGMSFEPIEYMFGRIRVIQAELHSNKGST